MRCFRMYHAVRGISSNNSHRKCGWAKCMVILLALDVSSSMLARDFDPDRFEAAKSVASQFVAGRPNDNIGML